MGLDMYLYVRKTETSIGNFMAHSKVPLVLPFELKPLVDSFDIEMDADDKALHNGVSGFFPHEVTRKTDYRLGYWRKANWLHHWFVENCADGVDDCKEVILYKDNLEKLLQILEAVDSTHSVEVAMEALPTCSGFFFGSTEYDEYYFKEVKYTIPIIKAALAILTWDNDRYGDNYKNLSDDEKYTDYYIVYEASW